MESVQLFAGEAGCTTAGLMKRAFNAYRGLLLLNKLSCLMHHCVVYQAQIIPEP